MRTEILVVGGGLGGVAAALAAHRGGRDVLLTEETDWVGGQLTAQAVPPDEHRWIERFGCTASYRLLRDRVAGGGAALGRLSGVSRTCADRRIVATVAGDDPHVRHPGADGRPRRT